MFFDKQYNLRKGPDGRIHSLDPREEESLQRQYAKVSSMTEEEAWKRLVSRLRGDRVASLHQANLIDQRIKEIEAALENKEEQHEY